METYPSIVEFPVRHNLPFDLDGSDRYLSTLRVLKLEAHDFDEAEWERIRRHRLHWANEDGTWPSDRLIWESCIYHARWLVDYAFFRLSGSWWAQSGNALKWCEGSRLFAKQRAKSSPELLREAMDFCIEEGGFYPTTPKGDGLFHHLPAALPSLSSLLGFTIRLPKESEQA